MSRPRPSRLTLPLKPQLRRRGKFHLESFVPFILSNLSERTSYGVGQIYRERYGIGRSEWRTIAVLGKCRQASVGEIAAATCMDKVPISRALKALVRKKLVRLRIDAADSRRRQASLSPKGKALHADVTARALRWERALLAELSPREVDALQGALINLDRALRVKGL